MTLNTLTTFHTLQTRFGFIKSILSGAGALYAATNHNINGTSRFSAAQRLQKQKLTVTSADGTRIAFWKTGSGPPLVLVHGTTADHTTTWRFVLSELEKRFTVCAMDRRGRGGSGDAPGYELKVEAEDVAAIINSIGEPVHLIGHSYGALCAIEASLLTENIHRMILYEGVPLNGTNLYRHGVVGLLENLLEDGNVEGMLIAMFREIVEMLPDEIEMMRSQHDAWEVRLRNAPSLPRELRTEVNYLFEPYRFSDMHTPTLLLVGGDSPPRELENAKGVAAALPNARVSILPGQQHVAMYAAPEMFTNEIVQFLLEPEPD
jgi:pimeloyl-ACP methyl ester carboxylesterase